MIKHAGGCFCGEVRFTVKLDEEPRVFNCHCIDCRKKIGGMITIVQLRDGAIEIDNSNLSINQTLDLAMNHVNSLLNK